MSVVFPAPKNPVMIVKGVFSASFAVDCSAMAAAWRAGVSFGEPLNRAKADQGGAAGLIAAVAAVKGQPEATLKRAIER